MNQFQQPKILIVDDDENLCEILSGELNQDKFNTTYVLNGTEALKRIKTEHFDIVILNYMMPGLRGDQVLAAIQEYDPSIPVIMLTAHADIATAEKCASLGAVDFFSKPYEYDDILSSIIKHYN